MTVDRHYTPRAIARIGAQILARHLPAPARVLEPCAGSGRCADALRAAGYDVTTGDLDPAAPVDRRWDYLEAVRLGRGRARWASLPIIGSPTTPRRPSTCSATRSARPSPRRWCGR